MTCESTRGVAVRGLAVWTCEGLLLGVAVHFPAVGTPPLALWLGLGLFNALILMSARRARSSPGPAAPLRPITVPRARA